MKVLDKDSQMLYNVLMTEDNQPQTIRVRLTVVNQPSGRPDSDSEREYPVDTPIGIMFTARPSAVGSTIVQTEGEYVRTWELLS